MWGRIYPHVILLIFANIFKASCEGTSSLTFVIDDTGSMADDIAQVKRSVKKIMDIVYTEKSSLINNMVLVTFNEPIDSQVKLRTVTKNRFTFETALNSIIAHNVVHHDCQEPTMHGLLLALNSSLPGSYIYVFTDAPAKDYIKSFYVKEMCQRKQSQIVFVLTGRGRCGADFEDPAFNVYFEIAAACSGLPFVLKRSKVNQAIRTIEETIKGNKTVMASRTIPANVYTDIPFTIDEHTDYAIVSASGTRVSLTISGPYAHQERIMWNDNGKVIKLSGAIPGRYVATVRGKTTTSVVIVGRTDFLFSHGFSKLEPKTLGDTSPQPIADAKVHLSIFVTDQKHSVKIKSVQILQMDEKPIIKKLPLTEVSKDFYITKPFVAPSQMFKIAVKGTVKATGKPITRIAKIPVTPQKPPKKLPNKTKPTVNIGEGKSTEVEYNSTVKLTCKVTAYPKPKIMWINSKGATMKSSNSVLQYPYEYISYMTLSNASKGDKYTCYVVNDEGKDSKTIHLSVKDPLVVKSTPEGTTRVVYGSEGTITCDIRSPLSMHIHWYYANEITGENGQIATSDKYWISPDGTQLKIKTMDLNLVGKYTCKASLRNKDVLKSFSTRVIIDGLKTPKITGATDKKASKGTTAVIECKVNGLPKPNITWQFMGKTSSKYAPIVGSENVLHISSVEEKHGGRYKCVAENVAGRDEHVTTLIIQDLPKITSNHSTIYQSIEGGAVLRIPCVSTGFPKPFITWKLKGLTITPNAKYSIEDGALIIRDLKVSDTNAYTCEAKNDVGSVSATFHTHILQTPKVSGITDKKVRVGTTASIECTVKGEPNPKIAWQFMDKSGSKFIPIGGSDNVLHITNVEIKHAGRYKCVAQNNVGSDEHVTTLIVEFSPGIISKPSTIHEGLEGDIALKIPCDVVGVPKPVVTWKLKGKTITANAKYSIEGGALIIRDLKVSDTNGYTCEAKNDVGSVSATFHTHILQTPKVSGITDKKVRVGTTASIECTVKGEPNPKIAWQFMDKSGSKFIPIGGSDNVLHITNVEIKHAGRYKCVAQNNVGSDEHVTTLIVESSPGIISKPSTIHEGLEGDIALKIPCDVVGVPKPVVTWKLKGKTITANAKYSIEGGALIIRDLKVSDTNGYTCEAKNDVGSVSATFHTHILQTPKVSGITDKKVRVGTTASIECTVKGEPNPKIAWQFMDKSGSKFIPIGGSDNVLHITNVEIKHAGRYKCVAQNNVGSDEHVTTLIVESSPGIISKPSTIHEGLEGDIALKIPCDVVGVPKPVVTWKLKGKTITANAKYSIEGGALIIRDLKVSDTNGYTCEAKNDVGSVSATFHTHILQTPKVSGITDKKVRVGTTASIECTVKGEPNPKIAWQFMDKSGSKFIPIGGSDNVLHITNVEIKHAGRYKCVAQNNVGSDEHVTTLIVESYPGIISKPSTIHEGLEGDIALKIPCDVVGVPKPVVTWKLKGKTITANAKYSIEGGALIIRDLKVSDTNGYTCEAKNDVGSVSATFHTHILQTPKVSGIADKKLRVGTTASIECTVKGEPKPKIVWQFMDKSGSKFIPIGGSDNVLHINNVENKHAGRYKCVAQNNVGSDEHVTTVIVESPPRIISKPSTIHEGLEGDIALKIPCDVVGVPKPVVTWKLKGKTITANAKYSIEGGALVIMNPNVNDSTSYTCEVKNYIGAVSETFEAKVEKLFNDLGLKHHVYLLVGETRKLECEAYSSKSQSVRWFIGGEEKKIKEPYLQLVNASVSNDGNYTCRVSDKHGNTHTHTYVVDVGHPPRLYDQAAVNDWRGDISHIWSNCQNVAKPPADVEWKFNGKVLQNLTDLGISYNWGHYSCNISNVHGSVQSNFDVKSSACLINRNLRDAQHMPLLLTDDLTWPKWETTKHYSVVEQEEKITLSCPYHKETPNTFQKFPKQSELKAFCNKQDMFLVDGKFYKLSDLHCSKSIQPSIARKKVKCLTDTSELIRVGYNVAGFLETYEVCFDHAKNMPLYTRVLMTPTKESLNAAHNWYKYPGIGEGKRDRRFTCENSLSSCCYSKSQLVNARDFNYGPAKYSTFIDPLNAIPFWRPCTNTKKTTWDDINDMVRSRLNSYSEFVAWSGTHTLQEKNGAIIPRYLWKVLRLDEDESIAIVHVNDPSPTDKDIKCEDNYCSTDKDDWFKPIDKYTYCCKLSDFLEAFDFHGTDIGESLDVALGKIEEST